MTQEPTFTLHKLPQGFVVTSDEDILDEDLQFSERQSIFSKNNVPYGDTKKVIAQQDQIDFSALSEEEQKRIGWFDVEKEAMSYLDRNYSLSYERTTWQKLHEKTYIAGFNKSQEFTSDRMFTEKQILEWYEAMRNGDWVEPSKYFSQSWNIELEMEKVDITIEKSDLFEDYESYNLKPKLTNGKFKILRIL